MNDYYIMSMRIGLCFLLSFLLYSNLLYAQHFYFGADMSYVNEMEDCGVKYFEDRMQKDPFEILADHGGKMVRLRLWHTPKWYDSLNSGNRYSDLSDVKKAIKRAHDADMEVLLDFHLSDSWADPNKQLVPKAWLPIVENTEILKDSVYQYFYQTLRHLNQENLLPKWIQIGNETNRGILLSPEDNQTWTLDWARNSVLFNAAIDAVEEIEQENKKDINIVLHVAGPENAEWMVHEFARAGVTRFETIGLSYYWAWHRPTSIEETGEVIKTLKGLYTDKEVLIVETGYIWTNDWNDEAANIISVTHPDYDPPSPENQRDWLNDLSQSVINNQGIGVIYWEPFWVSSPCSTRWGQGSHQEHAVFFDFENQLLIPGGIEWMNSEYDYSEAEKKTKRYKGFQLLTNTFSGDIRILQHRKKAKTFAYRVKNSAGKLILNGRKKAKDLALTLAEHPVGMYYISVERKGKERLLKAFRLGEF